MAANYNMKWIPPREYRKFYTHFQETVLYYGRRLAKRDFCFTGI